LRATVGIFLLRFANKKICRLVIYGLITVGIAYGAVFLATTIFQCIPLSYFWERIYDITGHAGTCFDANFSVKMTIGFTVVAAVIDWTFALLPIWLLWDLRLSKQKKIMVCFLFGLGALYASKVIWLFEFYADKFTSRASAAPIVRIPYLAGLMNNTDFLCTSEPTLPINTPVLMNIALGATTGVAVWSVVELGVGIIVISLPACRPLFRSIQFFSSMARSKANSNIKPVSPYSSNKTAVESSNESTAAGRTFYIDRSAVTDVESSVMATVNDRSNKYG
jgi:rhodopsin domain-containing protein